MPSKLMARVGEHDVAIDWNEAMANHSVLEVEPGVYSVVNGAGRSFEVRIHAKPKSASWLVEVAGQSLEVEVCDPRARSAKGHGAGAHGRQNIVAPMPGKVVRVLVSAGDTVEAGQGVVVVEAMKMQNEMKSPKDGKVAQVLTEAGATVAVGDTLVVIE